VTPCFIRRSLNTFAVRITGALIFLVLILIFQEVAQRQSSTGPAQRLVRGIHIGCITAKCSTFLLLQTASGLIFVLQRRCRLGGRFHDDVGRGYYGSCFNVFSSIWSRELSVMSVVPSVDRCVSIVIVRNASLYCDQKLRYLTVQPVLMMDSGSMCKARPIESRRHDARRLSCVGRGPRLAREVIYGAVFDTIAGYCRRDRDPERNVQKLSKVVCRRKVKRSENFLPPRVANKLVVVLYAMLGIQTLVSTLRIVAFALHYTFADAILEFPQIWVQFRRTCLIHTQQRDCFGRDSRTQKRSSTAAM